MSDFATFQRNNPDFPGEICIRYGEPMSKHTSFRIGGAVEAMAFPNNRADLSLLLNWSGLLDRKPVILGAGTNVLAPDEGMEGLIICLKDCLDGIERLDDRRIRVMAGVTLSRAAVFAASQGLSGMEFAHGIPGTLGGGVYMNAGAYGGELAAVCREVELMDFKGSLYTRTGEEMDFSYRHSCLETESAIVVSAVLELEPGREEDIRGRMKTLQTKRLASQPLNLPSAGSAFKRPAGGYAAALIEQAGLKGFRVGNAAISEKHAGFAVNLGGATAADVKRLLEEVSRRVEEHSGIRLEPEIRIL